MKEVDILFRTKITVIVKHLLKLDQYKFAQKDIWSIYFCTALLIKNIKIYLFCVKVLFSVLCENDRMIVTPEEKLFWCVRYTTGICNEKSAKDPLHVTFWQPLIYLIIHSFLWSIMLLDFVPRLFNVTLNFASKVVDQVFILYSWKTIK